MARSRLDADRLAAAYERDARRMLVYFTRRTHDAQLAVDLVGDTYARAFELRRVFSGDARADALAAWVCGIARNVLNEVLRRSSAERHCRGSPRRRLSLAHVRWLSRQCCIGRVHYLRHRLKSRHRVRDADPERV